MSDPTIACPSCGVEIKLNESLAAPLIAETKKQYEEKLAAKERDVGKREATLLRERENLDQELAERLEKARSSIAGEEARKAQLLVATDLEAKARELTTLQDVLKDRDVRLAEAQRSQAEVLRKQRELDDAKRELELTVEKRIQESLGPLREEVRREVFDQERLKLTEKENLITAMQKQIEELKQRAAQGSQQAQGDALEIDFEALLTERFPGDGITRVPKGEHGGDLLHVVRSASGTACGTILWESKRTKNWSEGWLTKLRDDQRAAKAEVSILISQALPKDQRDFGLVDEVWVTPPRTAIPVAIALRQLLIETSQARQSTVGQQEKSAMIYEYLTGPRFRQRVGAIVEAFSSMKDDLERERKVITKQWAKRDEQIDRVLTATAGMYGDLQGIAGKSLAEIDGLSLNALNAGSEE